VLQEPFKYITQVSGKEVRTQLINAFNVWLGVPADKLALVEEITRILHNASLLCALSRAT
jgi:geranylgeranyl diphosphate synthase type 3